MSHAIARILLDTEWAFIVYFVLVCGSNLALLLSSAIGIHRHLLETKSENLRTLLSSPFAPRISMLVPAHNEAASVVSNLAAILTLDYPDLEVIAVNDGSSDDTMGVLSRAFALEKLSAAPDPRIPVKPVLGLYRSSTHPRLMVIDKENGGKADSLNAALGLASGDLVCAIDADTLIEPDALLRMVRPFISGTGVLAVGGVVRVVNHSMVTANRVREVLAPRRMLPGIQAVEYLRAFLFGRLGWNNLGGNVIISGAFGLFDRRSTVAAGGYESDTVGEDMELVLRLRRNAREKGKPDRVEFVPDPVAWTEVPESIRVLGRQRDRWHRGLSDCCQRNMRLLFNPRYGVLGLVVFPYYVLVELLSPVLEALGTVIVAIGIPLGVVSWPVAGWFFLASCGGGLLLSMAALSIEEFSYHRYRDARDRLWLCLWAVLENLGYRQLTVFWRLRGIARYLSGSRDWGAMQRVGFTAAPALATPTGSAGAGTDAARAEGPAGGGSRLTR